MVAGYWLLVAGYWFGTTVIPAKAGIPELGVGVGVGVGVGKGVSVKGDPGFHRDDRLTFLIRAKITN